MHVLIFILAPFSGQLKDRAEKKEKKSGKADRRMGEIVPEARVLNI